MPATACCSLNRSPPGPWPGHYSFTFYLVLLFICYMKLHNIFLIPDISLSLYISLSLPLPLSLSLSLSLPLSLSLSLSLSPSPSSSLDVYLSPTLSLERVELPVIDETVRSAVISLIEHDDNIMRKILDIVTKELVLRLTADPNFTERIAKQITETDIVNEIKQDLYASCSLDQATSADNLDAMGQRVAKLERDNNALRIELDTQEQYSRRNCLLLHGVPETQADTTAAALEVIESKLNVKLPRNAIDRSHRLGRTTGSVSAAASLAQ